MIIECFVSIVKQLVPNQMRDSSNFLLFILENSFLHTILELQHKLTKLAKNTKFLLWFLIMATL